MSDSAYGGESLIAVVIPAYRVKAHILEVLNRIPERVSFIIVIDDCCPDNSGQFVLENYSDDRLIVIRNETNLGVGGSVVRGYEKALEMNCSIVVKLDGDGQMDPHDISILVKPIEQGRADYTKGNRFFHLAGFKSMPFNRKIGNAGLSFLSKFSTGYWSIFDPNNGFTAINSQILELIPMEKLDKRFFFESDLLFRLSLVRGVVVDIPMVARYGDEVSNLSSFKSFFEFSFKHVRNFVRRVFYSYFLREFSIASLNLLVGSCLVLFSVGYGFQNWISSIRTDLPSNVGSQVLFTVTLLLGFQLILNFLTYDISRESKMPQNILGTIRNSWK